jgi:thymidylate kinase
MHTLLLHVFKQLEQTQIRYCVIRGYEELETLDDRGDVDLLVAAEQMPELRVILSQLQFVRLPSWGHAPHQFYVAYDEATDRWLKLDIVTEVVYGKPIPTLATDLAAGCLARRQPRGETYVPAPEDELITLLLHCLLDKGAFAPHRLARVQALRHEVRDEALMNRLLRSVWAADMTWARLASLIDNESWSALLAEAAGIARRLKRGQRLAAVRRRVGSMVLRKLDRVAGALQPRSLTVALLAPDGGGKTTLATELARRFFLPSRYIYMGTNIEASTVGLPTTRWIQKKSRSGSKPLRLLTRGLRFPNNVAEQWYRYGASYYHMLRGRLVLFDRYVYDAPGGARKMSLKSRLRRWALVAIAPEPDLVVFLDAPGAVLYARKGEHSPAILEEQRQHYLGLQQHLPQMVVIDATNSADQVRRKVTSLIWQWYAKNLRGDKSPRPKRRAALGDR